MRNQINVRIVFIPVVFIAFVILAGFTPVKGQDNHPPQDVSNELIGIWQDLETNGLTTIEEIDGILAVTSIKDDDGENLEILESIWENGTLKWSYKVPSTGYILNMEEKNVSGDTMNCHWSNGTAEGMQEFKRVQ